MGSDDDEDADAISADIDEIDVNRPLPSMEELEKIARHFGPSMKQFGVQTRVWQVNLLDPTTVIALQSFVG